MKAAGGSKLGRKWNVTGLYLHIIFIAMLLALVGCGSSGNGGADLIASDLTANPGLVDIGGGDETGDPAQNPGTDTPDTAKDWSSVDTVGDIGGGWDHSVVSGADGNSMAVWVELGSETTIYANRFIVGEGWQGAEALDTGDVADPSVAVSDNGYAVVGWDKYEEGDVFAYVNLFDPNTGWSGQTGLGAGSLNPAISMDANGNAVVVWQIWSGSTYDIMAKTYAVGSGWGEPVALETMDGYAGYAKVSYGPEGLAMAVWQQVYGSRNAIFAAIYNKTTNQWGSTELVGYFEDGNARYPEVLFAKSGGGAAVTWNQSTGGYNTVMVNMYYAGQGWSGATDLMAGVAGDAYNAKLDFDANGNAMAVWYNYNYESEHGGDIIMAASYDKTNGWGEPTVVDMGGEAGYVDFPDVKFAADGRALVVWQKNSGEEDYSSIAFAWFTKGSGFGDVQYIPGLQCTKEGCAQTLSACNPRVAADATGNLTVTWFVYCPSCSADSKVLSVRYE